MKYLFSSLYIQVLRLSAHRHAAWYLGILGFFEAIFFPVPIDVLLLPMVLAKPEKMWHYATLATAVSVIGGAFGYLIGIFFSDIVLNAFTALNLINHYEKAVLLFEKWGVWIILLAGFTPLPYKVFTLTAGMFSMTFIPFILASIVGRGARYFLVAGLIGHYGKKVEPILLRYMDMIGWAVVVVCFIAWIISIVY